MKHKINKYDLIIYSSLILAIICLSVGGLEYQKSVTQSATIEETIKETLHHKKENKIKEEKPAILENYNPARDINNYINSIIDGVIIDETIAPEIINSWNGYTIINNKYIREISKNYYEYKVIFKINNKKGKLPKKADETLSTDSYNVIELKVNILYDDTNKTFNVKKIDA